MGVVSLVTLVVFSAQPMPLEKAALSGLVAGEDCCRRCWRSRSGPCTAMSRSVVRWVSCSWNSLPRGGRADRQGSSLSVGAGHTLQTTALIHEAYLKLAGDSRKPWENRAQF